MNADARDSNGPLEFSTPVNIGELLHLLRRHPQAELWGGGTHLLALRDRAHRRGEAEAMPSMIVSLHQVRELRRVVRSDLHVDVGAAVPFGRLREVGERFLPKIVLDAIQSIGPPPIQNTATIGGAVCCNECVLPIAVMLQLLDTRAEVRRHGHSRWQPLNALRVGGRIRLNSGEVITRLRIPLRSWSSWINHSFGRPYPVGSAGLTVAGVAAVDKGTLTELRLALVWDGRHLAINRNAEAELLGRSLPLSDRDRKSTVDMILSSDPIAKEIPNLTWRRAQYSLQQFLKGLGK